METQSNLESVFQSKGKNHYEMNIRFGALGVELPEDVRGKQAVMPVDDMPLKLLEDPIVMQHAKECAFAAINDGYTHLVYNFVRSGNS